MSTSLENEPDGTNIENLYRDALSVTSTSNPSTNDTESNLPGAGRTLGRFYDSAGRRLEKAMGIVAQKVGYRPRSDVIYQEIVLELSRAGWMNDEKKSVLFLISSSTRQTMTIHYYVGRRISKYCLELLDHALTM